MGFLPDSVVIEITSLVEQADLTLLEISTRGQAQTTVVTVVVDHLTRSATLDEVAELSRSVSNTLDTAADQIKGRYRLEVTTPGLDRPLTHVWQFQKNVGRLLNVSFSSPTGTPVTGTYRLTGIESEQVLLTLVDKKSRGSKGVIPEPLAVNISDISKATVEPEF